MNNYFSDIFYEVITYNSQLKKDLIRLISENPQDSLLNKIKFDRDNLIEIAIDENYKLLGYTRGHIFHNLSNPRQEVLWGRLDSLFVLPEYRFNYIASSLINKLKQDFALREVFEISAFPTLELYSCHFYSRQGINEETTYDNFLNLS